MSSKNNSPKEVVEAHDNGPDMLSSQSEVYTIRLEKIMRMKKEGINPWPVGKPVSSHSLSVKNEFDECQSSKKYSIAGRVMTVREHGKSIFAHIQDSFGQLQIYIKKDESPESFYLFSSYIDIGDIVWFEGTSFKTKLGEITLHVNACALLSKCLYPLPDKFHGIADIEIKYRQRYLDLIMSETSRKKFKARSAIVQQVRDTLNAYDCMEVETPMLHPIPGGAAAKPFITHHNALDTDLYLRIAPELFLKRLVVGGFDRVYEMNRCFRNEGVSTRHNPEFSSVEYYIAYEDYHFMMDVTETIIKECVKKVASSYQLTFGNVTIDFEKPFLRIAMQDAVADALKCDSIDLQDQKKLDTFCVNNGITCVPGNDSWGYKLYALFEKLVESTLIQPTFITEFPVEVSPLSKRNKDRPELVDRFELFIAGMEISNGFSELNDPFDQAERFAQQAQARSAGDDEAHFYDADFILALEYGLPPTVGAGIGIDRLVMLLTNTVSIRDIILFPTLKKKEEQ